MWRCATHRTKGTCTNERTIMRQEIEGRILDGLKHRLMAPELFKEFADEYRRQINKANAELGAIKAQLARVSLLLIPSGAEILPIRRACG